ncbi:MAG: hypothetical protein ABW196_04120 [Solirubrobacterales bacterium]
MRGRRRHRWRRSRFAVIAVLGLSLLAPLDAVALDSDLKGSAVFRLEASHGYTILGFASSERIDGRGDIGLIVYRKGAVAFYAAPATVTPTRLEADLGALGKFSAEIVPSGRKKQLRSRCDDDVSTVEPDVYRGRFEFHGEQGYTDVVATDVPEYPQFFLDFLCLGVSGEEAGGRGLPGARLRAFSRHRGRRVSLQLNKNRPGKATIFEATLAEARDGIEIERTVSGRQPAAAFEYDPLLRMATVEPAAPFSGVAAYRRDAVPANRWTGTLSVDFPGRANVPLTGSAFSVHVAHAQRKG